MEPASDNKDLGDLVDLSFMSTGSPASFQALYPPIISVAFSRPSSCKAKAARLEESQVRKPIALEVKLMHVYTWMYNLPDKTL